MGKRIIAIIAAATLICLSVCTLSVFADFGSGVAVMAERTEIVKTGISGKKMVFSDLDFKQGLCITDFEKIEITAVPEQSDGTLLLAGRRVGVGTVIKRKNIGALVFVPASSAKDECRFSFKTEDFADGAEVDFIIRFSEKVNYAPVAVVKDGDAVLKTQRNVCIYGQMQAEDSEGDNLKFVVISYPENGRLEILNEENGEFLYTPPTEYTGTDSFRYVARDEWGNYSRPVKVEVSVCERMSEVEYEDMKLSENYNAAIALTAMGVVDGRRIGDGVYFMPDEKVSVAEFTFMAMKCAGISPKSELTSTYFDDNDEIPPELMGYIATAAELGIIQGNFENGELLLKPNEPITRYRAAMIMAEIADGTADTAIPVFSDAKSVPVWAKSAVYEMCALGIFEPQGDMIYGSEALTKGECVNYLFKMVSPLR